jgi:hypothetical protein
MRRHMGMGRDKNYFYAFSWEKIQIKLSDSEL